jgi:NAD(P)-dependent dehydrogenase (short-subunit alcohol dehydrogenase family)
LNGLSDKNIIITGASSGIGRQIAIEASKQGANLILIARNREKLEETLSLLSNGRHFVFPFDVSDFPNMEPLVESIVSAAGVISGFVHSAGTEATIPLRNMKPEIYENIFRVNVIAAFELARLIAKKKNVDSRGGSFVFLSSVMGKLGKEGKVAYCSSKSALSGGVKAMALELSSRKIRCNAVLPGIVKTEMAERMFETLPEASVTEIVRQHPLGLGSPEDVAHLTVFLLSDKSKWITGSEIVIDGGYSAQ